MKMIILFHLLIRSGILPLITSIPVMDQGSDLFSNVTNACCLQNHSSVDVTIGLVDLNSFP